MNYSPDVKWLRCFVVVAEELHFGRASVRLNIVQPAVTYQIRQLEQALDVRLFERSTRTVSLTAAGTLYLQEIRLALQHIDQARLGAKAAADGTAGPLSIGFVDNATWSIFTEVVREFRSAYPRIELELRQMSRTAQADALADGQLDLGIMPGPVSRHGLVSSPLTQAPLDVVLPSHHPLAARMSVPIALLADEKFVTFPSKADPRRIDEIILSICGTAGFTPMLGQAVQQMHTALALVSTGFGVAVVPRWMRRAWERNVAYRELSPVTPYTLLTVSAQGRTLPAVAAFRRTAEHHVRTNGLDHADAAGDGKLDQ